MWTVHVPPFAAVQLLSSWQEYIGPRGGKRASTHTNQYPRRLASRIRPAKKGVHDGPTKTAVCVVGKSIETNLAPDVARVKCTVNLPCTIPRRAHGPETLSSLRPFSMSSTPVT